MKLLPLILALSAALTVRADGNPYRFPVRVVNDGRVNLLPLFAWWSDAAEHAQGEESLPPSDNTTTSSEVLPPRPLPRWVRVKSDNWKRHSFGWTMEAEVERSPGVSMTMRIFLKHPPVADKARFDYLVAWRAWLADFNKSPSAGAGKRAGDISAATRLQNLSAELASLASQGYRWGDLPRSANNYGGKEGRVMSDLRLATQRAASAVAELQAVQVQLAAYQMGTYKVDLFAVFTGQYSGGLPVFDLGSIY